MPHICTSHCKYNPANSSTGCVSYLPLLELLYQRINCLAKKYLENGQYFLLMLDCDWNLVEREAHAKDANDDHVPAVDPHQDGHLPRLVAVHEAHV